MVSVTVKIVAELNNTTLQHIDLSILKIKYTIKNTACPIILPYNFYDLIRITYRKDNE